MFVQKVGWSFLNEAWAGEATLWCDSCFPSFADGFGRDKLKMAAVAIGSTGMRHG